MTKQTANKSMSADRYRIHVLYRGAAIRTRYEYRDTLSAAIKAAERIAGSDVVRRTVADPVYGVREAVVIVEGRVTQHDAYGRPYHNRERGWQAVAAVAAERVAA
jgi:hypothetical protein